jgi:hypothetical protein
MVDEPGMFKFMERWKDGAKDDPSVGWPADGKGLPWVDDVSWEALQARVRIIHGGIGSDGYTGQRKQDGTPDKRTSQYKAWSESEPEAEAEAEADTVGVYSTALQHAGALHGMLQALHEEVKAFGDVCVSEENPHGRNPDEEFRPELLLPPTKAPKPERKAAHVPTATEED